MFLKIFLGIIIFFGEGVVGGGEGREIPIYVL